MVTVPSSTTDWEPGDIPKAADFNSQIHDVIAFKLNPPSVLVRNTGTKNIAATTWTLLTWNTDVYDTDTMHDTGTNTSRLVAATAGRYVVTCLVRWEAISTGPNGARSVQIRKNAGGSSTGGTLVTVGNYKACSNTSIPGTSAITGEVVLAEDDYVEAFVWHNQDVFFNTNDSINIEFSTDTTDRSNHFGAVWVSEI